MGSERRVKDAVNDHVRWGIDNQKKMTEREKTLLLLRLHTLFIVDLTYTKLKLLKTKYLDKIP